MKISNRLRLPNWQDIGISKKVTKLNTLFSANEQSDEL